ncbi:S8 family peptidase [Streptomyces sp. YIM 98790]|uniref:S8 family peptidase n=1 Tax=Streptomyces sp. YIM 98790 TaxID=2689077 RepID=UPI00140E3225|nr:S8 family peptidase [Streptomyces sp. YIM 98790]
MRRVPSTAGMLTATLALALLPASGAAAEPATEPTAPAAGAARQQGEPLHTVTLLTGDRVDVDARGRVAAVRPAPDREDIPVSVRGDENHTYVVPRDAAALIRSGTVDHRLFDVRELVRAGYDDDRRNDLPLIVRHENPASGAAGPLRGAPARAGRPLPSIDAEAVSVGKAETDTVWRDLTAGDGSGHLLADDGIERIWLDAPYRAVLDESVPQIGAPEAWEAGYDGTGATVAVLDSGVDQTHPDLQGREAAQRNFTGDGEPVDRYGHGTHVASIAVGGGEQSGGTYTGTAPGARYLDGKVLDDNGFGQASWIIAGMEWAVGQGADVVNLSIGGPDTPETDPVEAALAALSEESGTLFVVAAGNSGPGAGTVESPGSSPEALTVGAVDDADRIAAFSSRGPTAAHAVKPDLTAPGVDIAAAAAEEGVIGEPVTDGYVSLSGTSMATPHVAGAAAILAQQHPDWTGERIKQQLTATVAHPVQASPHDQGTGRVQLPGAVSGTVSHDRAVVGFGVQRWPHEDTEPATEQLGYRNTGDEPVTLTLSTDSYGPGGVDVPVAVFDTAEDTVTVPAGATATVDVLADTSVGEAYGDYSGLLTAQAEDGTTVRTALGVYREPESYDLTLRHTGRDGEPTADYTTTLIGLDNLTRSTPYDSDGTVTLRLERGAFAVDTDIFTTEGGEITGTDWLNRPLLELDRDITVDLDARRARPVEVTVPDARAEQRLASVGYRASYDGRVYFASRSGVSFDGLRTAHLGPELPGGALTSQVSGIWERTEGRDAPVRYRPVFTRRAALPTGFTHHTARDELARVDVGLGASVPDRTGEYLARPVMNAVDALSAPFTHGLPDTAVEYLRTADARWQLDFRQTGQDPGSRVTYRTEIRDYAAGERHRERFNTAVIGPSLKDGSSGITRRGNTLSAAVPLFADGDDHLGFWQVRNPLSVLYRNGERIWEDRSELTGQPVRVPADEAEYRLTTDVYRDSDVAGVSTRVTAEWTFTSARPQDEQPAELPATVVRFAPRLALDSSAGNRRWLRVPYTLQGTAAQEGVADIAFEVSYDGGESWEPVTALRSGSFWLRHPRGAEHVSLRADVTDETGARLVQTIHRAYTLGR